MKIRSDYVTNSSSSSFVLAFNDEEHLDEFKSHCDWYDYNLFYEYVKDWIKPATNNDKKRIIEKLRRYYEYEKCDRDVLIEKHVKREDYPNPWDYYKACEEYSKTDEYKKEMELAIQKTNFYKKRKAVKRAKYIIDETIWDSNGGMMEWCIRNGFIQREMWKYCIFVWDIG